jgi:UDPglucose 6-dehydrogenase
MHVGVVGAGYVGITTAACLVHLGNQVSCGDVDEERIAGLVRGEVPIVEEGLEELVRSGLEAGRLRFVIGAAGAAQGCEVVFLCVPTPQRPDGSADMSYIEAAASEIASVLKPGAIVVNKSTVPVGSTRVVEQALGRSDVLVVSNPEFLREGSAVHDFLHPDRIVIGSDERDAAIRVASLYRSIPAPLVLTDPASAETIKYASNAFLATKLSFINAVANLCEVVGADIRDVVAGIGYDRRIGFDFLSPGPGWGGSCLPKDTAALVRIAEDAGYDFQLLKGVIAVNDEQRNIVVGMIRESVGGELAGRRVALWGLTFKAGTDDMRESPAIAVARSLLEEGAEVRAYDPAISDGQARRDAALGLLRGDLGEPVGAFGSIRTGEPPSARSSPAVTVCSDPYAACEGAQVVAVVTEWDEFRWLDFSKVGSVMASPRIVDARNLLDPAILRRHGFTYRGIGRGSR